MAKEKTKIYNSGIAESLIATAIVFSPNIIFLLMGYYWIGILYNFVLVFSLISTVVHYRFDISFKTSANIDPLIYKKKDKFHKLYKDIKP